MNIIISNKAHEQIQKIYEYISQDSLYYANKTKNEIYSKIKMLGYMPYIGRKIPEYNRENLREIIYKSYRIMYEVFEKTDEIHIQKILHAKQYLKTFFINN